MTRFCLSDGVSFTVDNVIYFAFAGIILFILGFEVGPGALFFVMASQDFPAALLGMLLALAEDVPRPGSLHLQCHHVDLEHYHFLLLPHHHLLLGWRRHFWHLGLHPDPHPRLL